MSSPFTTVTFDDVHHEVDFMRQQRALRLASSDPQRLRELLSVLTDSVERATALAVHAHTQTAWHTHTRRSGPPQCRLGFPVAASTGQPQTGDDATLRQDAAPQLGAHGELQSRGGAHALVHVRQDLPLESRASAWYEVD
jgi:hypothetical protein